MEKGLINEAGKEKEKDKFDLRKMVKLIEKDKTLMDKYMDLYSKYRENLNYHYNESLLAIIYLFAVLKDSKLRNQYNGISVIESDPTRVLGEQEDYMEETTTASSAGQYSTKFAFKKGKPSSKATVPGGVRIEPNRERHTQGVDSFDVMGEARKTDSLANAEKIGTHNRKNADSDRMEFMKDFFKDGKLTFKDYFMKVADGDSKKEGDLVAHRNTSEEEEQVDLHRGRGMESLDPDYKDEEWEKRQAKSMKSPNTDLDMYEKGVKRKAERNRFKKTVYPKTSQPVHNIKESKADPFERVEDLLNYFDWIDKR